MPNSAQILSNSHTDLLHVVPSTRVGYHSLLEAIGLVDGSAADAITLALRVAKYVFLSKSPIAGISK
jgi:hypothetical protein